MVKFKVERDENNVMQRYIAASKGNNYRVRSMINPAFCQIVRKTKSLYTYEEISY